VNAARDSVGIIDCLPPRGQGRSLTPARVVWWVLLSGVLASVVLTWPVYSGIIFEVVPTPGYLLNGSFEGRWRADSLEAGESRAASHPQRIEFRISEDVKLARWRIHPDGLSLEPGVFARGSARSDGIERPCEFTVENGEFLIRSQGPNRTEDVRMWMYASESSFTPTLWRTRSSDELDLWFSPDQPPIHYVRDN